MKPLPTVTIVFPIHNGWRETKACLVSIRQLDYPPPRLSVIVIDNASTDGSPELIRRYFPATKIITNRENLGFAKAINQAIKKARSELILITNNDVAFDKKAVKELVATFQVFSQTAAVGGHVVWKNQKDKLCFDGFRLNPYLAYHQHDLSGQNQSRECDWVSGNCLLTSREIFNKLRGFDEKYFFYFEDIDFCLRARKRGYQLRYCPTALAYHGYGKTILKKASEYIFYINYCSRWRCVLKNTTLLQRLTSSLFLLTFAPLWQTILTRHNIFLPMIKGLSANFR